MFNLFMHVGLSYVPLEARLLILGGMLWLFSIAYTKGVDAWNYR